MGGVGGAFDAGPLAGQGGAPGPDMGAGGAPDVSPPVDAPFDVPPPDVPPPDMAADLAMDLPAPDVPPEAPVVRKALLVVGSSTALTMGDMRVRAALEARSLMVTLGNDDGPASQADGMDLVVVASSSVSMSVAAKYRTTALPILNMEQAIMDDMGMTGPTEDTDYGEAAGTQVAIVNAAHPLAAGLTGTVTVASNGGTMTWGAPAASAVRVATMTGANAARITIFYYDAGTMMVGLAAPARRVGFFTSDSIAQRLLADGGRLLDAAIAFTTP